MKIRSKLTASVAALVLLLTAAGAHACTVTATNHAFGTIDPLVAAATDSASEIEVTCPTTQSYTISLDTGGSGTFAERQLDSGSDLLGYNLYTGASRSTVWGDGTGGSSTVPGSAGTAGTVHTVYGRVPHDATASPGTYTDTVVVTISY